MSHHASIRPLALLLFLAALLALTAQPAFAASFTVNAGVTDIAAKTLGAGSGQTGTIATTGTLTVSGSTVAVTISGNNATLTNNGTIKQTGTGRVIRDNTGVTGLVINNGSVTNSTALMQAADADVIQMNKSPASVTLNNYGTMTSLNASAGGSQAVDFNAIFSGSNTINNFSTGLMQAVQADAVRPGVNGVVYNAGTMKAITTTSSSSDGIDAQNNTGVQITNDSSGLVEGGRHGITGGAVDNTVTFTTSITNNLGGIIQGDNGSGINLDGFDAKQTATVINHGTITGNGVTGDGDGIDVDGLINLTNTGTIKSINAFSSTTPAQSEGVTVGGGTITNSGTIEGDVAGGNTNAVGRGISLLGNDITTGPLAGTREAIYGNATVTNQAGGLIRGQTDSGIYVDGPASGFTVTITNEAGGTIRGAGTNATIQTGADSDTVVNSGSIINDGGNSKTAIALGAGDDHLTISGSSAVVTGGIDGGSGGETTGDRLTFDLGAASSTFTHSGVISNFEKVEVLSGKVTLNGDNTYAGTTTVGGGLIQAVLNVGGMHTGGGDYTIASNGVLTGTGTLALASGANVTIQNGGILSLGADPLTMASGSIFADGTLRFFLNAPGDYGQLAFAAGNAGGLTLGSGSTLDLELVFAPVVGEQFMLVDMLNPGSLITGQFAGHAEGSFFMDDGLRFQISYHGGDGNDLVVTRAAPDTCATVVLLAGAFGLMAWARRRVHA